MGVAMNTRSQATPRRAADGFSLIEVLIASAIFLIIAVGILPLFVRAILNNSRGNDATQVTNNTRGELEAISQLPFNNDQISPVGGATSAQIIQSWTDGDSPDIGAADQRWWPGAPTDKGTIRWTRTATVRQYGVADLINDGRLDPDSEAKPGNADPATVQLKEIVVEVQSSRTTSAALGPSPELIIRLIKAY